MIGHGRAPRVVVFMLLLAVGCGGQAKVGGPAVTSTPGTVSTTSIASDVDAIGRVALAGIMGQGTDDADLFIDHPEGLKQTRDALLAAYPEQAAARLVMRSVTVTSFTEASFVYDVELVAPLADRSLRDMVGHAVKIDGSWKVTRATACQVWGFGTGVCPFPASTESTISVPLPTSRREGTPFETPYALGLSHAPQPAATLLDGIHVVRVSAVDLKARTVTFTRYDWYGSSEYHDAIARGVLVPNDPCLELDYCSVQSDAFARTLPIVSDARVSVVDWARCCGSVRTDDLADVVQRVTDRDDHKLFLLTVAAGAVTALDEQYRS